MLESQMQRIKNCLNFVNNFFKEDKESQKKQYCDKLEKILELTIKFFHKFDTPKIHGFSFYSYPTSLYVFLQIKNDVEARWQINKENQAENFEQSITTKEFVNYCWEKQVDIKSFITSLFNYFSQLIAKKEQVIKEKKNKYITEINCLNEALENLQELIDTDIPEELKNN